MFAAAPLLVLPVLIYNLVTLTMPGLFHAVDAGARLTVPLFSIRMTSNVDWPVSLGDILLAVGLVVLFIELLKSANSRRTAIINHSLSMVLFIACLVDFAVDSPDSRGIVRSQPADRPCWPPAWRRDCWHCPAAHAP